MYLSVVLITSMGRAQGFVLDLESWMSLLCIYQVTICIAAFVSTVSEYLFSTFCITLFIIEDL